VLLGPAHGVEADAYVEEPVVGVVEAVEVHARILSDIQNQRLTALYAMAHNEAMNTTQQLAEATANRDAARIRYNEATTAKARRDAAEDLDWWIGKVAFLNTMEAA